VLAKGCVLALTVWQAIEEATMNAGKIISAVFGPKILDITSESLLQFLTCGFGV
jgi:hypothetical protein